MGTLENDVSRRFCNGHLDRLIEQRFVRYHPLRLDTARGGNDQFRFGIINARCQLVRGETSEDHRVDRTNPGAGQHGDDRLGHHGHVDEHPVATAHPQPLEDAGEEGHLGREELDVIIPTLKHLRAKGMQLTGPLPADTAFQPHLLEQHDAVLAMYHDQGLPVLKYAGFGEAINITLGLPFIRTSVDHGTAFDLAGNGTASAGSLIAATRLALTLATPQHNA